MTKITEKVAVCGHRSLHVRHFFILTLLKNNSMPARRENKTKKKSEDFVLVVDSFTVSFFTAGYFPFLAFF